MVVHWIASAASRGRDASSRFAISVNHDECLYEFLESISEPLVLYEGSTYTASTRPFYFGCKRLRA
jgi:hypothetical protein